MYVTMWRLGLASVPLCTVVLALGGLWESGVSPVSASAAKQVWGGTCLPLDESVHHLDDTAETTICSPTCGFRQTPYAAVQFDHPEASDESYTAFYLVCSDNPLCVGVVADITGCGQIEHFD